MAISPTPDISLPPQTQVQTMTQTQFNPFDLFQAHTQELSWLASSHVQETQDWHAGSNTSFSETLFSQKFAEFDRTLMTIKCLKLFLDGSQPAHEQFIQAQREPKLSLEHFQAIHTQLSNFRSSCSDLTPEQVDDLLVANLIIGDLGKSKEARDYFSEHIENQAVDHDDFHTQMMAVLKDKPHLCETFNKLPKAAQDLMVKSANLAHYGHITHLEGGPNMFSALKSSEVVQTQDQQALTLDLLTFIADVSGAAGHVNVQSSLVYIDDTHKGVDLTQKACRLLLDNPQTTEQEAYDFVVSQRAKWLGLDPTLPENRVLAKLGAMLRFYSKEEGAGLREGFSKLENDDQKRITTYLDLKSDSVIKRTPTYIPAVFGNIYNHPDLKTKSVHEKAEITVVKSLPFVSKVLEKHTQDIEANRFDAQTPLNFNPVAGTVKADIDALVNAGFEIDDKGAVTVK